MRCSSSDRATMQLRRSPGGSMLKSLRRRPEEPPSSVTVTTAAKSAISEVEEAAQSAKLTWHLSQSNRVDRPVPPPMATTRKGVRGAGPPGELVVPGFTVKNSTYNQRSHHKPAFTSCLRSEDQAYGTSGYSNSVNRGSSTML